MPYITREDGERFIIPSYRDTLSAKKISLLKKEIVLLSTNYGEYITLQKKSSIAYEVAFSPDPGYLLGECVWHYFKRPYDLIYCEAIPNTSDAILVIVKAGSVYLDGSFPIDSIAEELVVFKTQQNNFNVYIYGNVPISQTPEDGKFSFDGNSIRSFNILEAPLFPKLPGVKAFQLQLVDTVLKSHGIGILPTKQLIIAFVFAGILYMGYSYITTHEKELPMAFTNATNPYQGYLEQLSSPDPSREMRGVFNAMTLLFTIPGWELQSLDYTPGSPAKVRALLMSDGARIQILLDWAYRNDVTIDILPDGVYATLYIANARREPPETINPLRDVIAAMLDRMSYVIPGNNLAISAITDKKQYKTAMLTVNFNQLAPMTLATLGEYIEGLPLVLNKFTIKADNGEMSGVITFQALGS